MPIGSFASKARAAAAALLAVPLACLPLPASAQDVFEIHTGVWRPYVGAAGEPPASAERIVRLVLDDMGAEPVVRRTGYAYAYFTVREGEASAAFPFFETEGRRDEVVFSTPLFQVNNRLYYNRRFHDLSGEDADLSNLRFGRVAGYSYGEALDRVTTDPVTFQTEVEAMQALLANTIDILPMTDAVATATLERHFPNRQQLILPVVSVDPAPSSLHVIAPDTDGGRAFIAAFDASHARLTQAGVIVAVDPTPASPAPAQGDVAELVASEGFPVVVGVDASDAARHFAVPQGTRVLVTEWSPRIQRPADGEGLYQTMVEESLVVVLNGPHVGKELRVKNMHIAIVE